MVYKDEIELNAEQIEAIHTTEGYVCVIAGAGSGKTKALTNRYIYLVNELGILPENILCVTFTNKAAREMKDRVKEELGDLDIGYISTFHGLCVQILRDDGYRIKVPKTFSIIDDSDIDEILDEVFLDLNINSNQLTFSQAKSFISAVKAKTDYISLIVDSSLQELNDKYLRLKGNTDYRNEESIRRLVCLGYLCFQRKIYALDFNDLIRFTLYLLNKNQETREKWQSQFEYIMVDEFQDIDESQYKLINILSEKNGNLFVVGDPDQLIYSWRGASPKIFNIFKENHKPCHEIDMMTNYRSSKQIIDVSNTLISYNKNRTEKELISTNNKENKVTYYHAPTSEKEMRWVADNICRLIDSGANYGDIAVLYRAHYISQCIESELTTRKIPYKVYSGFPFFSRKEIKTAISYLTMLVNPKNDLAFKRTLNVPPRNIGSSRIKLLEEYSKKYGVSLFEALQAKITNGIFVDTKAEDYLNMIFKYSKDEYLCQPSNTFNMLMGDSGYEEELRKQGNEDRLDNYTELKRIISKYEKTKEEKTSIDELLKEIALFTSLDDNDERDNVKLMTVHAAKGLEFPYVFTIEMNDGVFPTYKAKDPAKLEEERRLAFVAFTRAKEQLFVSDSEGTKANYPSRFVFEFGKHIPDFKKLIGSELAEKAEKYFKESISTNNFYSENKQTDNTIKPCTRILHKPFGTGTVIRYDKSKNAYAIKFDSFKEERLISVGIKLEVIK